MNDGGDRVSSNIAHNQTSHVQDNLLRSVNPAEGGGGITPANLSNSSDFIVNESSNQNNDVDVSKNSNESEILQNAEDDSVVGIDPNNENLDIAKYTEDNNLPQTAILLETEWGSKVYIVGTAHFSEKSQEDVARVIQAVQPNFIVLELCNSRSYMLKWEENEILRMAEKMDFKMMNETIRGYGVVQGIMYLLLFSMSAKCTRELGMAPGGEFRRAFKEASNIPGCVVHLGDRPIEITLQRAFASMSWWQSIKFAFYILFSTKTFDEEEVEKCKNQDYIEKMLGMLGGEFPELKKVFVNERDLCLAYRLIVASMMTTGPQGVIPNTVVGVVGIGHLAGIQQNWQKIDPEELRKVFQVPPPSRSSRIIKFTLKASVVCLALYGVHKLASKSRLYSSLFR